MEWILIGVACIVWSGIGYLGELVVTRKTEYPSTEWFNKALRWRQYYMGLTLVALLGFILVVF